MTRDEARAFRKARPGGRLFIKLGPDRRPETDSAGRWLVAVGGCRFDEIPLRYLDWLSGQPWVYGELRQRLTAYLMQDLIQRELADQFRDPELEATDFTMVGQFDPKWHGQPMPAEEPVPDYKPRKITRAQRWQWLAELALAIDNARLVHELPACQNLGRLFEGLPFERLAQVRYAWELARRTLPTS
jgi:hypothetical protein